MLALDYAQVLKELSDTHFPDAAKNSWFRIIPPPSTHTSPRHFPRVSEVAAYIGSGPMGALDGCAGLIRSKVQRARGRAIAAGEFPVDAVSQTVGISVGTLERWRAEISTNRQG